MNKVRVLLLSGCSYCHDLVIKLDKAGSRYVALDADVNDGLATAVEKLLRLTRYPIVIVDRAPITTFLYITDDATQLGLQSIDHHTNKIGCVSVDAVVHNLNILNN